MKNFKFEANEMLQRDEMKTILGGKAQAQMICADGTSHSASSCSDWAIQETCGTHGGLDICSGGGN